jgi:hypothetical protein
MGNQRSTAVYERLRGERKRQKYAEERPVPKRAGYYRWPQ